MEARKIVVIQTKTQRKSVIMSAATTLAELKADLRDNNIDYIDMTFYEGISKTELKTDESVLPHDIPYKGKITNDLVFMLTNTNKKIRSGIMTRAELYAKIKEMKLQDVCLKRFGKNFTTCRTTDLITLVEDNTPKSDSKEANPNTIVETKEATETKVVKKDKTSSCSCKDDIARTVVSKLLEILIDNNIILDYDVEGLQEMLENDNNSTMYSENNHSESLKSPYSDTEIDSMFSGLV